MDRYTIISADCHAGLPTGEYRPYLESEFHARLDEFLAERQAELDAKAAAGGRNEEYEEKWEAQEGLRGAWDATRRDSELDGDGVAGEVIFPDSDAVTGLTCPPFGAGLGSTGETDPDLAFAGARAHNRWLAELCATNPDRRAGVALVPIVHDVDMSLQMIREARDAGLRGGILVPAMWNDRPPYHDERYDPVWATCAELSMPVHVHSGPAPRAEYGDSIGIYLSEVIWWAFRAMRFMLWGGVFERHPGLRLVVTESGAFWAVDMLWKMAAHWGAVGGGAAKLAKQIGASLSKSPVEYFDENCAIGASPVNRVEIGRRYAIGIDNIMWGNDFPHPEGTWPHTRVNLKETFGDVPTDETARMLGANAAELYGFDVDALAPVVDRIGPTPEELGQDDAANREKWAAQQAVGRFWETGADAAEIGQIL